MSAGASYMTPVYTDVERAFAVGDVEFGVGARTSASMRTGSFMRDAAGEVRPGAVAPLVDAVLGYAIDAAVESWTVSSEISIQFLAPVPDDGEELWCHAVGQRTGPILGFAHGEVRGLDGRSIARASQRGRLVEGDPPLSEPEPVPTDTNLCSFVGGHVSGDELIVPLEPRLSNPMGMLHGGVAAFASEWLASTVLGRLPHTVSLTIQYFRAMMGNRARYQAFPRHSGRTLGTVDIEGYDGDGLLCTRATVVRGDLSAMG